MRFITDCAPERLDDFVRSHPTKSHFMQSSAWAEFCRAEKGVTPRLVALEKDDGGLAASAVLLERRPPMFPPYFYCPRGPVLDYSDRPLLLRFLRELTEFARSQGAMFVKLDPDCVIRRYLSDDTPDPDFRGDASLADELVAAGLRHHGYNTGFEGRQPRYTFRIDLTGSDAEIDRRFTGNLLKNVKKSRRYACEIRRGDERDINVLHRLISLTGERDDFVGYPESYYLNLYRILAARGMATLWVGRVDPSASVDMLRAELAELLRKRAQLKKEGPLRESELSEQRLLREIETFEGYARQFPSGADISAHLVLRFGDKAWAVHAGSDTRMSETFINNRVYYEKLHAAKADGALLLDQFGTVGDPQHSPLRSLHEFKKQFGGSYIEFAGEFDSVIRPFWYWLYERALPMYRRARISLKLALRRRAGDAR